MKWMSEEKRRSVTINVLLSLCSLAVGFGISQISLAQTVHVTAANQASLQRELGEVKADWTKMFLDERQRNDTRTYEMRQLVTAVISGQGEHTKLMSELVMLVKLQNPSSSTSRRDP